MKKVVAILLFVALLATLTGCKTETAKDKKLRDLEFTVVEEVDQPKQVKDMIEEKKVQHMKLSYNDGEYLYVIVGYGEQKSGGFSIQVNQFYETENAIYIDTTLLGPDGNDTVTQALTYPYVVIKTEAIDKPVVYE
ncbi:protease complex subunit PrcB family protein [[Clostridium] polysaccharolyticum]|uniref:PrcB C-terminal n=1 Tax=[Clostridium] polysaccharolyticum TaxID=29364 RepID=A0A1I0G0E6_9FIRM|nr:protease complex subunit PrcB family protein [[Clostridium] polysaccharolyticum]SET63445.1 PrcB C-terminal [[Clostridium] polysaccharolyticum]